MASYRTKLSELNYHNWVKATLAVLLTKEGIEPFVYKEIQQFQLKCLDDICYDNGLVNGTSCSSCCTENVVACPTRSICRVHHGNCGFHLNVATNYNKAGCPSKICHDLKDRIQHSHRYYGPSYKNSDATQWCSNPWEVAKCFMPPDGYKDVKCPTETDFNGINSIIINHIGFKAMITNRSIFEKAREISKEVRHSSTLEINAETLQRYFTELNTLLSDSVYLVNDENAKEAQQKLLQLQNDKLPLGEVYIRKVLDDAANVITVDIRNELDENKKQQREEHLKLIEISKKEIEILFQDKEKHVYSQIENKLSLAVDKIERKKSEALATIDTKVRAELTNAIIEIQNSGNEHVEKVEEMKTKALTDINTKANDKLSKVKEELQKHGDKYVKTVEDNKSKALEEMGRKANDEIERATSEIRKTGDEQVERLEKSSKATEANLLNDLRDDLISFYRYQHRTISMSPLIEEESPLLKFYVMPQICSVNVKRTSLGVEEEKTEVSPFGNVFYKENKLCRKIYLTADAGLGKTALSKRLALTWCHAKQPHTEEGQFFTREEIQAMGEFSFVFLLLLRDSSSECNIDDLILDQILSQLHPRYTRDKLTDILFTERCLVILDGLDEWCHPSNSCKQNKCSIPHGKAWEQTVVLTTTRPWKLGVSGLHSSQIEQKLEIKGLNHKSANALKKSIISHLCADKVQYNEEEFTRTLKAKQISDLETIPLLLMYLLFLWCNKIELGHSLCDLYSQITELLLSRTMQKPKVDLQQDDIPQCLSKQTHCKIFYSLLKALGKLAYQTLFGETREENTLVFDSSVAEDYLNEECLTFCLNTGLLTKSKLPVTQLPHKSKVSFAHKTVQEFFAALYIRSTPDQTSVPEIVLSKCKFVKDILEMSKILIFLSGLNVDVSSSISCKLMKIISDDEITREYRSSLEESEPHKQLQDICVSCFKELPHDSEVNLCLQDVFIDDSCEFEQYPENLKQLTARNLQNIRSLYIDMYEMSATPHSSAHDVIEYFALSDLENNEKIIYKGEVIDHGILPLMKMSIKSLTLSCRSSPSCLSVSLFEKVTSLQKLEAICIHGFAMNHERLTLLCDYISQRHCMREIELVGLRCTDHEESCTRCSLNLSHNSQLRKIGLCDIPVSDLRINMSSLEKCYLRDLYNPDLVLRFINCVPANSKVNTFRCLDLKSSAAIETILQTLPLLVHVKYVELSRINLGNRELVSSDMVNIERVVLWWVTIPASVLREIVTVIQKRQQTVTVDIHDCDITPEREFVTVKEEIKQSSKFRVLKESEGRIWKYLTFETIKHGD